MHMSRAQLRALQQFTLYMSLCSYGLGAMAIDSVFSHVVSAEHMAGRQAGLVGGAMRLADVHCYRM